MSVGILLSIDVYMSKNASIDELPRNYTDEVLPRYIPRKFRGSLVCRKCPRNIPRENFVGIIPRKSIPTDIFLGLFRGTFPSVYTEGKVPRNKPRKMSVGILLSIDVYMSKNASIDELPRNYTDEVLPRYIPRKFRGSLVCRKCPRNIPRENFVGIIPRKFIDRCVFGHIYIDR
uniref:Uncharacterized protein n=1 Tax=Brassica oleracea var. oleracea TaxID=109376 RepID=A0A0D3DYB2_BRAOL